MSDCVGDMCMPVVVTQQVGVPVGTLVRVYTQTGTDRNETKNPMHELVHL